MVGLEARALTIETIETIETMDPPEPPRVDPPGARARTRLARAVPWAAVTLAVALFWGAALYGIASPFYYGHYGYHGGSYATWARGTLRHHTLLPVNEPGFAPPRPGSYYIHHPVLTHQLVTLTFLIFGEHEWSVRLGALIPSFLSLLLVTAIAWRKLGRFAGAFAALTFAMVPVNIWYSVNIDQGFPSIACLLGFFWFYLRWLDTERWSFGLAALGLELLAGGFEWSPYFAFPAIFAHVAWTGARRRGRFAGFAALHPLVVVLPLGGHFLLVRRSGMWNDLLGAYRNRAADVTYAGFVEVMRRYGETLFGKALLIVMALWLALTLGRALAGRGRSVDLVGVTFALALIAYVHVFKVAVITHAYRQLYGNVWAAMAVADLGAEAQALAARWLSRRRRTPPGAGWPAAALLVAALLAKTAPIAWAGLIESRAHGGIPGWKIFNPDLRQTAFASELGRRTRPGDVVYFHPSFASPPPSRMDWAFYYDRDLRRSYPLRALLRLSPADRRHAVAVVLPRMLAGDELDAYFDLVQRHPVLHIEDLALIDLRLDGPDSRRFALRPVDRRRTSALGRWLEGPYPWPHLIPVPGGTREDERPVRSTAPTALRPAAGGRLGPLPGLAPASPAAALSPATATATGSRPSASRATPAPNERTSLVPERPLDPRRPSARRKRARTRTRTM